MKIDRMLGIVTHLMRRGRCTAKELAQRFEVSERTILRDVEHICLAGIPLVTQQGGGGGIAIAEGYRVGDALLTENELRALLAGVSAMDSIGRGRYAGALAEKFPEQADGDWISIDLSHGAELFETLRDAVLQHRVLQITYLYPKGESVRKVEPLKIVYKWGGWYLIAWCRLRQDHRLFRMGRIRAAETLQEVFEPRAVPQGMLLPDPNEPPCALTALYAPEMHYLLTEECAQDITAMPDGRLRAVTHFANEAMRLEYALRLGSRIEVLEPDCVRRELAQQARRMIRLYGTEE